MKANRRWTHVSLAGRLCTGVAGWVYTGVDAGMVCTGIDAGMVCTGIDAGMVCTGVLQYAPTASPSPRPSLRTTPPPIQ
jgi:hypothetical protein